MKNLVDFYISEFSLDTRLKLEEIRQIIKKAAPNAQEIISYKMPAYKQNGILVYFAGYKNHIGFYPTSRGIEEFKNEFINYKWSKGAVQFPLNEPLPKQLIARIVRSRVTDEKIKAESKQKK
jgi:uncharacterized protein YdhG (YjbR/CyaY superfamily)